MLLGEAQASRRSTGFRTKHRLLGEAQASRRSTGYWTKHRSLGKAQATGKSTGYWAKHRSLGKAQATGQSTGFWENHALRSNVFLSFPSNASLFKSSLKEKKIMPLSDDDSPTLHLLIKLVQKLPLIVGSNS